MSSTSRIISVLVRRAVLLTIALVVIMLATAVIIGATGYDKKILQAIVETELQAYRQQLVQQNIPTADIQKLVEQRRQELVQIYGLDKPWTQRVVPMAVRALILDLGYVKSEEVANIVGEQLPLKVKDAILITLPRTVVMLTIAEIICTIIALWLAPLIAYRRGSLLDRAAISYAALMNALPVWWLGILFIFIFGYHLRIAPTNYHGVIKYINSFTEDPVGALKGLLYYSWLPITTVVIALLGGWLYGVRAIALRVVGEDYVAVARAKGLPERLVIRRYILRVIAGPVATIVILSLATSIGGFIITESVFNWPGMGSLYYAAISSGDAPTIIGLVYITTVVYIVARFILEVLYVALDPRVRY
ncbi:ABC transporter permease [Hyperthermus butylicus]|uniref:ABC transporter permease n=1 Tax=Hyperthermus butylicus TaxID=54248 RepID=UPI000325BDC2|nr:ABC transporter permease [Hyperthermus butylicus]